MGTLIVFVVTLACVFVVVESMLVKKPNDCQTLVNCASALDNSLEEQEDLPTLLDISNEVALDRFCQSTQVALQCVDDSRSECTSEAVVREVEGSVAAGSYICSDDGRTATLALAESDCVNNEDKQLEVNEGIQRCIDDFEYDILMLDVAAASQHTVPDPNDVCLFAEAWVECTVSVGKDKCGDSYGTFLRNVLNSSAGPQFQELGCAIGVNQKRRQLKRTSFILFRKSIPGRK